MKDAERPQRPTTLVTREWDHNNTDIAAFQDTPFGEQGILQEKRGIAWDTVWRWRRICDCI